jgi:hypothetical protein
MNSPFLYPAGSFSWAIALGGVAAIVLIVLATVVLHRTVARWENRRYRKGIDKSYDQL